MLRNCVTRSKYFWCFMPFRGEHDHIEKNETTTALYNEMKENETGWDRICAMFSIDEFGSITAEMNSINQATFVGMFIGACYGGFMRSRTAYLDFMERNQATTFTSHLEAKKKLQDSVTMNFAKGAFQWGWRLALFSGTYVLLTTTISVYRGRSGILEYAVAGGVSGGLYKATMGLRGVVVGTALGAALGCVAGCISLAILRMTGTSMEEVRFWQYGWKQAREKRIHEGMKKVSAEKDPLLRQHDEKVIATKPSSEPTVLPQGA